MAVGNTMFREEGKSTSHLWAWSIKSSCGLLFGKEKPKEAFEKQKFYLVTSSSPSISHWYEILGCKSKGHQEKVCTQEKDIEEDNIKTDFKQPSLLFWNLQEKYLTKKTNLHFAFVNLEKDFDWVTRGVVWWMLRKLEESNWLRLHYESTWMLEAMSESMGLSEVIFWSKYVIYHNTESTIQRNLARKSRRTALWWWIGNN